MTSDTALVAPSRDSALRVASTTAVASSAARIRGVLRSGSPPNFFLIRSQKFGSRRMRSPETWTSTVPCSFMNGNIAASARIANAMREGRTGIAPPARA